MRSDINRPHPLSKTIRYPYMHMRMRSTKLTSRIWHMLMRIAALWLYNICFLYIIFNKFTKTTSF